MNIKQLISFFVILSAPAHALAATPSVDEIINQTNKMAYYQGRDGRAKVKMTISDAQERLRTREFIILRRDEPVSDDIKNQAYLGEQKLYVYFNRPADVNKMVFMVHKKIKKN